MSSTQVAIVWIFAATVAIWPIRLLVLAFLIPRLDILTLRSPRSHPDRPGLPKVTAFIPAKDEQDALGDCLASVAAQDYPDLEIVVVDDRSTDRTPEIARTFAESDRRARVVTIADLPLGWTGKTHALHLAAEQARGEWFWFIDADTRHAPESLAVALEYARSHDAALMSLIPLMRCETFWENVVQPLAGIVLMQSYPPIFVNNDRMKLAFANGQYILIRRDAYLAAGGHSAVRDKFVEDIYLARRVKGLGLPIRTAISSEISSTRMYTSLGSILRGWSRILYDALDRKVWRLAGKILEPLVFGQVGLIAPVAGLYLLARGTDARFAAWLLGLSTVQFVFTYLVMRKMYRLSAPTTRYVLWYPLAVIIMDWILLKSIAMCLTGRVQWRGTAYGPATGAGRGAPKPL